MPPINPDPLGNPTFRRQFPLRPEDMRLLLEAAQQLQRSGDSASPTDVGAGTGIQISDTLIHAFYARLSAPPIITDPANSFYDFCEVIDDSSGANWIPADGPLRGSYLYNAQLGDRAYNAYPLSGDATIPVPGPPISVAISPEGESYYYKLTTSWKSDINGVTYQSGESLEVVGTGGATLTWDAPAAVPNYTNIGYSIWRGVIVGGENELIALLSATATTYTDLLNTGTPGSPIPGGNAGPIVWMFPNSAWDYYKFIDPASFYSTTAIAIINSSTPNSSGLYDATIQYYDPNTATWSDGPNIWLRDANA